MPTIERDLERVLAYKRDVLHAELGWLEAFQPGEATRRARLAAALGTWARPT